jgi:hypothetical protein
MSKNAPPDRKGGTRLNPSLIFHFAQDQAQDRPFDLWSKSKPFDPAQSVPQWELRDKLGTGSTVKE